MSSVVLRTRNRECSPEQKHFLAQWSYLAISGKIKTGLGFTLFCAPLDSGLRLQLAFAVACGTMAAQLLRELSELYGNRFTVSAKRLLITLPLAPAWCH